MINKIKTIGKSGLCSDDDLILFLPNLPTLQGHEFIFTISWADSKKYWDCDVEYFIKGLHIIEEKYKQYGGNKLGFGSLSPSYKVISALKEKDQVLAEALTKWIAENGGNYYI